MSKRSYTTPHGLQFREFGVLKEVRIDDWGVRLIGDDELVDNVGMKKVYAGWLRVARKAEDAIGQEVVIETGSSGDPQHFFRDIYAQDDLDPILQVPKDAGPNAEYELIWQRLRGEELRYSRMKLREELNSAKAEIEKLTTTSADDHLKAAVLLNEVQPQWEENPDRSILVVGQAFNGSRKEPAKIDKSFAIRMGINITKRKRLRVRYSGRAHVNNVLVELADFDNAACRLTLKIGNRAKTRNEWCAVSVNRLDKDWYDFEERMFPDWRSERRPIGWFLDAHRQITEAMQQASKAA